MYSNRKYPPERECKMDKEKIKQAVTLFLEGIGEDTTREGLQDTPDRIARMCEEIFGGMTQDAAVPLSRQFEASNSDMVIEKDITFYSVCEHHLLPFYGKVHIAYIPDGKVVGLSKLAPYGGSIRAPCADPGAADGADRGSARGASEAEGGYGIYRSRAYVHDDARH